MNTLGLFKFLRRILFALTDVALVISMTSNISIANAKSVKDVSQNLSLSSSDSCSGPVVYLSGTTTSVYNESTVANGTTFNRTAWYSDAVGATPNPAFSVGYGNPPPYDVCVFRGVINGHIPLDWSFATAHDYAGSGDKTYTAHLALVDGTRVHNVVDGWKPRELPEFGNTGVMLMRNAYMTGIRDDAIENDDFMPGWIEDSLFDGVRTFLSEQNQSESTPVTIGPNEDPYIRLTQVYVRLYPTNSNMTEPPNRWFKWMPRGTVNHKLIITDSVFATSQIPDGSWNQLSFPDGTIFQGTNYIVWLGTPGVYEGVIPPGVTFLEGQAAVDKWNQVRNSWLIVHGYNPRPVDDFNPMDDPVVAPVVTLISGNVGAADVTLNYTDGTPKTTVSQADGSYSFSVTPYWSGTVTPSNACYTFDPPNRNYGNVSGNQAGENYTAVFNPGSGCADIDVQAAGITQARFGLLPQTSTRPSIVGLNKGPISVTNNNSQSLIASQRVIFGGQSYSEMMGLPKEQLSKEYWFPYYNNVAMDSQLRVSNVGDVPTTINVYLGTQQIDSFSLAGNGATRKNYSGKNGGPLKVTSSDTNILSTIRVLFNGNSYSEMMGLPKEQLSKQYLFPYYNNVAVDSQLRVSNLGNVPTTIMVYLGTQQIDSYTLGGGSATRKNYAGKNGGPLKVTSSATNILSTIRVLYASNSYSEMMGLPLEQLAQEYWYPVYDNSALDSQLRVSNVGGGPTTITVYAANTQIDSYSLNAGAATRKNYAQNTGPLHVVSDPEPILSTIRMLYTTPTFSSYYEMMGLPDTQLSTQYFFPWYNNVAMNSELRFAVP